MSSCTNRAQYIRMVATFVPTILVQHYLSKVKTSSSRGEHMLPTSASFERLVSALLFIDISGFTPLSARLGALGAIGIEQLSRVLNEVSVARAKHESIATRNLQRYCSLALVGRYAPPRARSAGTLGSGPYMSATSTSSFSRFVSPWRVPRTIHIPCQD